MRGTSWAPAQSKEEAERRAAGRYRYNLTRKMDAARRRADVQKLARELARVGVPVRGMQAVIADRLGIPKSTLSRDFKEIKLDAGRPTRCPHCGRSLE